MRTYGALWLCGLLGCLAAFAQADDKGKGSDKPVEIKAKAQDYQAASAIDFQKGLNLPFNSLASLGGRIEQARQAADPVGLASAACELAAAEKASGKKASITSDKLKDEAAELAKLRDRSAELKAVKSLLGSSDKVDFDKLAVAASKREADEAAKAKSGERSKGIFNELVVTNGSEVHVEIYVNGNYLGCVDAYGHEHFPIHTHHETVLDARGPGHYWHSHVHEDYSTFSWTLND